MITKTGDQVGKVRDVVIQLRTANRPPRVKGLVIELFARRRVFLPMARVHSIDAQQLAINAQVNANRFVRRDSETLVIDDLFDRIVPRSGGQQAIIFDLAMKSSRLREWEISEVAIREAPAGRFKLGNRGQVSILDWHEIPNLVVTSEQSTDHFLASLADMKPADVARELHDLPEVRRAEVIDALDDEQLANALEELPEDEQVQLISQLETERAADVLEEMDPDDAADLIKELPEELAEVLLGHMEPDEARDVRNLLSYDDFTAGAMMTPEPVLLGPDATVADALARVRMEEVSPALASLAFVCRPPLDTPTGRYLGALHIQRLLREPPSVMVSGLMDTNLEPLTPDSPLPEVSRYFAIYNLVVAPVVNAENQLVGAVTVDDLLDHMLPPDWRGNQMDGWVPPVVNNG